jgi:hypothetical protein
MIKYKTIGPTSAELLLQLHQIGTAFFTIEQATAVKYWMPKVDLCLENLEF